MIFLIIQALHQEILEIQDFFVICTQRSIQANRLEHGLIQINYQNNALLNYYVYETHAYNYIIKSNFL
ncbi:unnamed protein product [Paramecium sonneborni]|uniref:Uncharacterized protein n=1 Tax=Paramecium sonneborni TaxID=65129 RepID=A0A8S1KLW1_9CILI|nr:unnamed protein product [Paramecium sonneborni]